MYRITRIASTVNKNKLCLRVIQQEAYRFTAGIACTANNTNLDLSCHRLLPLPDDRSPSDCQKFL